MSTDYIGVLISLFMTTTSNDMEINKCSLGWTKSLDIWKLAFEHMFVVDDIRDFKPRLGWALRFTL